MLEFSLDEVPFSMRGSWLSVSRVVGLHVRSPHVHLVSHQTGMHAVLAILPHDGELLLDAVPAATPQRLRWEAASGFMEAAFADANTVRLRGEGLSLRLEDAAAGLTSFTGSYLYTSPSDGSAVLTSYETGRRYRISRITGVFDVVGSELLGAGERGVRAGTDGGPWEVAVEELDSESPAPARIDAFDQVVAARHTEFHAYADAVAPFRAEHPAATLAAYVLWSATVRPLGFITRESVLMSKHWMDKVWSWDHCFNALALAPSHPELALDQFLVVFDHQAATGALPDSITHSEVLYNFVKPPIHGWAFGLLRERLARPIPRDTLIEVYSRLSAWTRYWLDCRRAPGSVLPFYEHGNDSGWDNSTVFDADRLIEAPDLAAFLVLQLDELARLADEIAPDDAAGWREESDAVAAALAEQLWDGETLSARSVIGRRPASRTSLLTTLPIVAAHRLSAGAVATLVDRIDAHLTRFGLATELVDSEHYTADGYWRGPIWAPSTSIIEAGLRAAGEVARADEISERFRRLCEQSGFAENFDALTGVGLRDRAYTWTASVYLSFAEAASERNSLPARRDSGGARTDGRMPHLKADPSHTVGGR
ncbi:amylo-alpha-1,6-glucosidase [Microbacterium sp. W4I4]|uniref:amylo-alpha-1,6-glucosidase n=1 Tax=Microbacterium sp. W4I4 TaxID=3042295 RepID=UPI0027D8F25A|nr:glycogen debranching protein [Microbacterium sp. W4I4]